MSELDLSAFVDDPIRALVDVMDKVPHWTFRMVVSPQGFCTEITVPSFEFQGFGDSPAMATYKAACKFVEWKQELAAC